MAAAAAATCMQSWLLFACVHAWCLSSLGFMWIHGCVDSCRCLSSLAYVEPGRVLAMSTRRVRFMFMPTRFKSDIDYCRLFQCRSMSNLIIVDLHRFRLWSMSTHYDVSSGQLRLTSMSTIVIVDTQYMEWCREYSRFSQPPVP